MTGGMRKLSALGQAETKSRAAPLSVKVAAATFPAESFPASDLIDTHVLLVQLYYVCG